jgi:hypothetical protein
MSLDLDPAELLVAALTAVLLALALAFPLAAAAIAGPRPSWNRAGLAMGLGLLAGVVLAGIGAVAGAGGLLTGVATAVVLEDGTAWAAAIGAAACALIGLGEPLQALPMLFGMSSSLLVVLAGAVLEAVALVVIVGALVAVAARVRALQIGIAVAGAVGALLVGVGTLLDLAHGLLDRHVPGIPLTATLIAVLVALAVGGIGGAVLETVRARRRSQPVADA